MNLQEEIAKKVLLNHAVKLHLGCGPVIIDGWINVDGDYMKDHPSVAIHDISKPFPCDDNLVDEILSVHVIEHLLPSDAKLMLTEWYRILKPGGQVAVEWPDILKMCKFITDDPTRIYSDSGKVLKRGLAGIYGNIDRYKDVAMLHKWGYSIDSLSHLLKNLGFINIRSEPNLYPKTEMCSRVVASK